MKRNLTEGYKFPGFKTLFWGKNDKNDPQAIIIPLERIQKKRIANFVKEVIAVIMTRKKSLSEINPAAI